MVKNDMSFLIGGDAGQGVESSGAGFAKALARAGLHVFTRADYHSRIRGGHNFTVIRARDSQIYSHRDQIHLVLAMTQETVAKHGHELVPGGGVIYEDGDDGARTALGRQDVQYFPMPLHKMASQANGSEIMRNTAALGAAAGVTGFDFGYVSSVIEENFRKKGQAAVDSNLKIAELAYDYGRREYAPDFEYKIERREGPQRMLIHGNHAFCLGAVLSGCNFIAGYPMTPATSVLEWMSTHAARLGLVTKHTEDEIAAVCMAIGAAHAGARALVPTSGGGFSLMVEALGLAGMTETPVVIFEAQRPGPSTGFATRTEQGDLKFVLSASQGEFPRIVLAPGTVEECFAAGARAFNLAEQYQCPVIVLSDEFLASSLRTIDPLDLDFQQVSVDRGEFLADRELDMLSEEYRRHAFTASGISPRAVPGHPKAVYATTSDEHDERGHITEDAENRTRMMRKRMAKMETATRDMADPVWYGPASAEMTFICWGSTYGPLREAVDLLNRHGQKTNMLSVLQVWPFPAGKLEEAIDGAGQVIAVEANYSGQMADLIRQVTGRQIDHRIARFDGRPFSPEYIIRALREELKLNV